MADADWKYLQYNVETGQKRTNDGPDAGPSSLADLDDTNISNPSNGQMLSYDGTEGKWKNTPAPEGSVTDVQVDGQSVVNQQGVAEITMPTVPVQDVEVDGTSVVNAQGIAEIQIPTPPTPDYPVTDVKVNGSSVVSNKQALITSYKEITQSQYEQLPSSKESDGVAYFIKDGRSSGGNGIDDVLVNGTSVVGQDNIARIPLPEEATMLCCGIDPLVASDATGVRKVNVTSYNNYSEYLSYDSSTGYFTVLKAFVAYITGWVENTATAQSSYSSGSIRINGDDVMSYRVADRTVGVKAGTYKRIRLNVNDSICCYTYSSDGWPSQRIKIYKTMYDPEVMYDQFYNELA